MPPHLQSDVQNSATCVLGLTLLNEDLIDLSKIGLRSLSPPPPNSGLCQLWHQSDHSCGTDILAWNLQWWQWELLIVLCICRKWGDCCRLERAERCGPDQYGQHQLAARQQHPSALHRGKHAFQVHREETSPAYVIQVRMLLQVSFELDFLPQPFSSGLLKVQMRYVGAVILGSNRLLRSQGDKKRISAEKMKANWRGQHHKPKSVTQLSRCKRETYCEVSGNT